MTGASPTPPTPAPTSNPSVPPQSHGQVDPPDTESPTTSPDLPDQDPPEAPDTRSGNSNGNGDSPEQFEPPKQGNQPSLGLTPSGNPAASTAEFPVVYVQGNPINEGAPPVTYDGKAVAYKSGSIYIGTTAIPASNINEQGVTTVAGLIFSFKADSKGGDSMPSLTIGTNIVTADSASHYVLGSQTIIPGGPAITASGTVVSLGAEASHLVIGTRTEEPRLGSVIMNGFGGPPQATQPSKPSRITSDGVVLSADTSQAMMGGKTYPMDSNLPSSTLVYDGRTFYLDPGGVTTAPTLSATIAGDLTFSLDATEAVIQGTRYPIGKGANPATIIVGDESLSIGPDGIAVPSYTIAPPDNMGSLSTMTLDGLTIALDAKKAVIQGTTYAIDPGSTPTSIPVGDETLSLGPDGVGFPATTISPPGPGGTFSLLTIDGVTVSLNPTNAVLDDKTYSIGNGAKATTVVVGNETVSLGPGGAGFPFTAIPPPNNTNNQLITFTGEGGRMIDRLGSGLKISSVISVILVVVLSML